MTKSAATLAHLSELITLAAEKGLRLLETPAEYSGRSVYYLQRGERTIFESFNLTQIERYLRLRAKSDDEIRALWREGGGAFIGLAQNAAMAGDQIIPFLRKIGGYA